MVTYTTLPAPTTHKSQNIRSLTNIPSQLSAWVSIRSTTQAYCRGHTVLDHQVLCQFTSTPTLLQMPTVLSTNLLTKTVKMDGFIRRCLPTSLQPDHTQKGPGQKASPCLLIRLEKGGVHAVHQYFPLLLLIYCRPVFKKRCLHMLLFIYTVTCRYLHVLGLLVWNQHCLCT